MTRPPTKPIPHVVKTAVLVDRERQVVKVGVVCDVCGEIQLPEIPYDHIQTFAELLRVTGRELRAPEFVYVPTGPRGGLVDDPEKFGDHIDLQNVIHEVLMLSKRKSGKASDN